MIHVGVRPVGETTIMEGKRWELSEKLPLGNVRYWDKRQLNSGCGNNVEGETNNRGLIYCPHCEEWFNKREFKNEL